MVTKKARKSQPLQVPTENQIKAMKEADAPEYEMWKDYRKEKD